MTVYINYTALIDAYGSGPPYYNRTTNMDKWASPLPRLAVFNAIALLALFATYLYSKSRK